MDQVYFRGIYYGGGINAEALAIQWHQGGMWNVAIDDWAAWYRAQGQGHSAVNYLYNQGYGTEIDWRENSEVYQLILSYFPLVIVEAQDYPFAENLCHLWQFGAVETPFYLYEALRDTGYYLYGGDLNFTSEIFPTWDGTEADSPLKPPYGNKSYGNTAGIWDVRSPEGTNGTTQSDICYPGQNM